MREPRQRFEDVFAAAQIPIRSRAVGAPPIQDGFVGILSRDGGSVFIGARRDMHSDELPKLFEAVRALRAILVIFPSEAQVRVEQTIDLNFAAQYAVCVIHRTNGATYIDWRRPGTEGAHHILRDNALEAITAP